MPLRDDLIARKAEVQAGIRSLRPRVEAERAKSEVAAALRRSFHAARLRSLEAQLDALIAEEARLRLEIDRSG